MYLSLSSPQIRQSLIWVINLEEQKLCCNVNHRTQPLKVLCQGCQAYVIWLTKQRVNVSLFRWFWVRKYSHIECARYLLQASRRFMFNEANPFSSVHSFSLFNGILINSTSSTPRKIDKRKVWKIPNEEEKQKGKK